MAKSQALRASEAFAQSLEEVVAWWQDTRGVQGQGERPAIPQSMLRTRIKLGVATERIVGGATSTGGKVHFYGVTSTGLTEDTGSTHTAWDLSTPGVGASEGEDVLIWRLTGTPRWQFMAIPSQRCRGYVESTSTGGSGSMTVDRVEAFWGASPTSSSAGTVTVSNSHGWAWEADALVKFERRNNSTGVQWDAYQVDCPAST